MPSANDLQARSQEIQDLILVDQVPKAIKRLMDFVRDFSDDKENLNEVVVISASYHRIEKAERRGRLEFKEAERQRDRKLYQILKLMDSIEHQPHLPVLSPP